MLRRNGRRYSIATSSFSFSTSPSPCVSREWSPDQGGLRVSRLRRRPPSATLSHHALRSRLAVISPPVSNAHPDSNVRLSRDPPFSPAVTRVYVTPRHNTHNSRHRHHGQFRQCPYRSATRPSISTTINAAARQPFKASLRGGLQADDAKLPLIRECATAAHRPGPQRSLKC